MKNFDVSLLADDALNSRAAENPYLKGVPPYGGSLKIQINTDNNITGREELAEQAKATVESTLGHLSEHITRVEVHLSDENSDKGGSHDKRCMMEARLEASGRLPT